MKITNEMLAQAKQCKSAEEIATLAKQNGIELAKGEAQEILRVLSAKGELKDSELSSVSGGVSYSGANCSGDTPRYQVGKRCRYYTDKSKMLYGTIIKVSDKKQGSIWKEFVYTIQNDNGQTDEVYEAALDDANQSFYETLQG